MRSLVYFVIRKIEFDSKVSCCLLTFGLWSKEDNMREGRHVVFNYLWLDVFGGTERQAVAILYIPLSALLLLT